RAVEDRRGRPPRGTVAFVDRTTIDLRPAQVRCSADTYQFGVLADACDDLDGREVVLMIDDGPYWFQLRGISVRGSARHIDPPATQEHKALVRYVIEAQRILACDYAAIREA